MNISTSDNHHDGINVGVAANQNLLDVFVFELGVRWQESNSHEGVKTLVKNLSYYKLSRILVEAKGAHVRHFVKACITRELPVIIVHPLEIIEQVKKREPSANIDNIEQVDAPLIAYLGATVKPEPHPIFGKKLNHIEELLGRKQQLNAMKIEETARHQAMPTAAMSLHTDFIHLLEKEMAAIDLTLAEEIAERREWQYIYEMLSESTLNIHK